MSPAKPLKLTPQQEGELRDALLSAFDRDRLAEVLYYRLGKRLDVIANMGSYEKDAFRLLERARMEGWQLDVLRAAREANPGNPELVEFVERLGSGLTAATPQLEKRIREDLPGVSLSKWREKLGKIEYQVCRVEMPEGVAAGTGFLVGPDVVMTNYHVLERVIAQGVPAQTVALRFDYKEIPGGVSVNAGTVYKLADTWLLDHSKYSAADLLADPTSQLPQADELDYALIRVRGAPGREPVGGSTQDPNAPKRGWISLPAVPHSFSPHAPLFIAQHPEGRPLELALDTDSIIKVNGNNTRVQYKTNTEPGSSGSPCFNVDWEWVALHHSGDPGSGPLYKPQYNAGIPVAAISKLLQQRGKSELLSPAAP